MGKRGAKINNRKNKPGFSLVELLVVVSVIAILAVISIVVYMSLEERAADAKVADTTKKITNDVLATIMSKKTVPETIENPSDLPPDVALTYTNTTTEGGLPVYEGVAGPEEGLLFSDICKELVADGFGRGPSDFGGGMVDYISSCTVYDTHYLQINGWNGGYNVSNPEVTEERLQGYVDDGAAANPDHPSYRITMQNFMNELISRFKAQGGTFPVADFWQPWTGEPTLPPPTSYTQPKKNFCIVVTSLDYPAISYNTSLEDPTPKPGATCS